MAKHKFARPCTVKTNQYAVAALKDRRATMAGEIQQFKEAIRHREDALAHLDATLRLLDPQYRADTLAPKVDEVLGLQMTGLKTAAEAPPPGDPADKSK